MIFIPRIYYAMAGDRILPPIFKQVNAKTQVQEFALSFFFGITVISMYLMESFEKLMNYTMFIDCMSLVFGAATVFILRKQMAQTIYNGYRMKLFPLFPILFMLVLICVCISILVADIQAAAIGMAIFVLGFPLYRIFFWFNRLS
jgi:basic amino acid/polyamine antiporter, APA family